MKQLKVLGLGDYKGYYSHLLYGIMEGSILNGAWFRGIDIFQSIEEIKRQILFFKPHIIVCHMIFNEDLKEQRLNLLSELRREIGCKVFYHAGDARKEPRYNGDISGSVDFALVNHGLLEEFGSIWKIPCHHWPYMTFKQKGISEPVDALKCPIIFTGSLDDNFHHIFRKDFVNRLREQIQVNVPEDRNTRFETAEISASADVVLGVQMGTDIPLYLDVRPFQYIGAGALYFHDACSQMDEFFIDKQHYVSYHRGDITDLIEKYKLYMFNTELAHRIRNSGFHYVQNNHSTKNRMEYVIDLYEERVPTLVKARRML